jgi:hypothetical protein
VFAGGARARSDHQLALTCWNGDAEVPITRFKVLAGERIVVCPKCGKTNSLDRPPPDR